MNVPNKLTVSRFVLTAAFLTVFFSQVRMGNTVALVLFSAAGLTDYFDGKIARRDKLITNFGILMDPLADKIMTCSAFIAFVDRNLMPAWMVVINRRARTGHHRASFVGRLQAGGPGGRRLRQA